jgi:hypothetical protein
METMSPWVKRLATHHPAKMLLDLAIAIACGGDDLSDAGLLRCEPALFGQVASDPVISRLIAQLGEQPDPVERAVDKARAEARSRVWGNSLARTRRALRRLSASR